jgi:hypothetical protein
MIIKKIKKELEDIKENGRLKGREIIDAIYRNIFKYKDIAYQNEKEWRIGISEKMMLEFKCRNNELVDFVEVKIPLSALKQITFAPLADYDKLKDSVEKMIKTQLGPNHLIHPNIEYRRSNIPYSG